MFELITISNARIIIRHIPGGHVYVYHLPRDPAQSLSNAPGIRPNDLSDHEFVDFLEAAHAFARDEARKAGVAS